MFETLTINYQTRHQTKTFRGRQFLVAPSVMITEGVHAGSRGALYYPANELQKSVQAWNYKPVVINHPSLNNPDNLDPITVGFIVNTRFENGKLHAELWLEKERLAKVDNRVLRAVMSNRVMEVSTGLGVTNDLVQGTHNGKQYTAIARDFRPHHLAILPDQVGACSVADSCGLLQNERHSPMNLIDVLNMRGIIAQPVQTDQHLSLPKMEFDSPNAKKNQQTQNKQEQPQRHLSLPKMTF